LIFFDRIVVASKRGVGAWIVTPLQCYDRMLWVRTTLILFDRIVVASKRGEGA